MRDEGLKRPACQELLEEALFDILATCSHKSVIGDPLQASTVYRNTDTIEGVNGNKYKCLGLKTLHLKTNAGNWHILHFNLLQCKMKII